MFAGWDAKIWQIEREASIVERSIKDTGKVFGKDIKDKENGNTLVVSLK